MFSSLVAALLPSTLSLLRLANPPPGVPPMLGGRAGAALLRLLGSVIEVAALELGQQGLEQLLGALVETYSAGGGAGCLVLALGHLAQWGTAMSCPPTPACLHMACCPPLLAPVRHT